MNHPSLDPGSSRTQSLSQRVAEQLTQRIQGGGIKPGERVPTEPELMREYGVSRSVVREAVSSLQAAGLVHTRHGVGSFVLPPQKGLALLPQPDGTRLRMQQKLAMLELRLSVEVEAAALASARHSSAQLSAMEGALLEFESQLAVGGETAAADFRFHELIAEATTNEYYLHVLRTLSGVTIPRAGSRPSNGGSGRRGRVGFGDTSPQLRPGKELAAQEHRAVLDAIRRQDAAMARASMYMHLCNSRDRMKAASG